MKKLFRVVVNINCDLEGNIDSEKAKTILKAEANTFCRYIGSEEYGEEDNWRIDIREITVDVKEIQEDLFREEE